MECFVIADMGCFAWEQDLRRQDVRCPGRRRISEKRGKDTKVRGWGTQDKLPTSQVFEAFSITMIKQEGKTFPNQVKIIRGQTYHNF